MIRPEEAEILRDYEAVVDDDDSIALQIPGYFKGEPRVRELHYGRGECALYVRNRHQGLILDRIPSDVRRRLSEAGEVHIEERDAKRQTMAVIVRDDQVDALIAEALSMHDYRFDYHPFPVLDGTFCTGENRCEHCGKRTSVFYFGPTGATHDNWGCKTVICPGCIAEGRTDIELFPELGKHFRGIGGGLFSCTPPFFDNGEPATHWGIHCSEPGIYLGRLEPEDLTPGLEREIRDSWDGSLFECGTPDNSLAALREGRENAYLFRCVRCGHVFATFTFRSGSGV